VIARLRPAGALLAAVAAWSVGLLLLSLAGLGGRVGVHPGNAALAPPVPQVRLEAVGSRLGPASDYLDVGNRPLLSPDRRPPPVVAGEGSGDAPLDAELTSVLIAGNVRLAILQGKSDGSNKRVRLGELVDGTAWRLVEIEPRRAVFEGPEGRRELALRVFDGTGGEPVTQVRAPAAPGADPAPPRPRDGTRTPAPAPATASAPVAEPAAAAPAAPAADLPVTPEQQVEAIRRRIEARRAQRAAEAAAERAAQDGAKQVE
jgi:general secretion pathway protein N